MLPRMVDELTRGQTAAYSVAQAAAAGEISLPQPRRRQSVDIAEYPRLDS
ncbi:MAG: hypothetical protein R2911_21270 [Caldilineaceae bacterium]